MYQHVEKTISNWLNLEFLKIIWTYLEKKLHMVS